MKNINLAFKKIISGTLAVLLVLNMDVLPYFSSVPYVSSLKQEALATGGTSNKRRLLIDRMMGQGSFKITTSSPSTSQTGERLELSFDKDKQVTIKSKNIRNEQRYGVETDWHLDTWMVGLQPVNTSSHTDTNYRSRIAHHHKTGLTPISRDGSTTLPSYVISAGLNTDSDKSDYPYKIVVKMTDHMYVGGSFAKEEALPMRCYARQTPCGTWEFKVVDLGGRTADTYCQDQDSNAPHYCATTPEYINEAGGVSKRRTIGNGIVEQADLNKFYKVWGESESNWRLDPPSVWQEESTRWKTLKACNDRVSWDDSDPDFQRCDEYDADDGSVLGQEDNLDFNTFFGDNYDNPARIDAVKQERNQCGGGSQTIEQFKYATFVADYPSGLKRVRIKVRKNGGSWQTLQDVNPTGDVYTYEHKTFTPGNYKIECYAEDNKGYSKTQTFDICGINGQKKFTLTTAAKIHPSGTTGGGSVGASPTQPAGGYDCGQNVILTAAPSAGHTFHHWSGDASGTAATTNVVMSANRSVTAHFQPTVTNAAPTVSAGADRSISLAQSATLDGTITDDGLPTPPGATTASWTKVSGPGTATFASSTSVDTTATFSVVGTYVLRLTGSDSVLSASDDMQVIVGPNNAAPTVSAGADRSISLAQSATLDGTITDDGLPTPPGATTASWTKVSGPGTATFASSTSVDTTATFSVVGTYVLRLTGSDSVLSASDDMQVIVGPNNAAPTVSAGADRSISLAQSATLDGTITDDGLPTPPGATTASWTKVSGPGTATFASSTSVDTTATFSVVGTYVLRLTGSDSVLSASDDMQVIVGPNNAAPTVSAGADRSISLAQSATLDGTITDDGLPTPPGATTASWTKVSGPGTATFASSTSVDTTATFSVVGTYVLRLTGSDSVLSASDDMQVIVGPNNAAPTVSAGADRSISLAQSATLDGTITDDGLPTPPGATTASWTKVSGPGTATFASSTSVDTTATFSVVGTYVLRLTGSDSVLSASDDMQVIVGPNNAAPTVSAGADRSISLAQSATLDGTITDDGLPTPPGATTASWTKVSGPGTATFASSTSVDTTATFSVVGTYVLRLTGSDSVLSASDDMQVIVGPNNAAPTVSAGADRSISLAQSATLDGTITDDGLPTPPGATTASWTKVSGPGTATFASSTSVDTTATFSVVGTYVLRLTGSDSVLSASDDMQVIVGPNNAAPTVSAGADRSISLAQSATLDGTITDDGLPTPPGATTASWTKVSGPGTATFASSTSVDTTATFSVVGTYVLRLTGSDSVLSASDDMQVIVGPNNAAPTVSAGADRSISLAQSATLDGTITDDGLPTPPGATTASWTKVSGPGTATFASSTSVDTTATFSVVGTYVLRLTGSDSVLSASDDMQVIVGPNNAAPTVSAGADRSISLAQSATLDGTITDDGLPTPPGATTASWTKVSGPGTATFASSTSVDTTATFSVVGTYVLRLTGSDSVLSASDDMQVIVGPNNAAPTVSAGADRSISLAQSATLDGTITDDGLPTPPGATTASWTKVSGPGTATFASSTSVDTTATFSVVGTYVLRLTGSDSVLSASDDMQVIVGPNNAAPTVSAGADRSISLAQSATLDGTITDDGLPTPPGATTASWTKVSGPGTATFASSTSVDTTATFSVVGTYVLRLTGSDSVLSASDDMQVIVGPNNAAPTVSAGADRSISLAQSATLDGTITDDGLPTPPGATTASWTKVSGPGTATFASSTSVDTTATFSVVGTYVLRLTGSDSVLSASDDMQVIVGPNNAAPTVSAGADRSISLAQSATLDGTITDDGLPTPPGATTASWTKVSGPGTATFASSTSVDTTATFSVVGTYVLRLTGSDSVLSASDDMQVIVGPNNAAPTVSAGADRSISLAQSATLDGTITDDGLPTPPGATTASWTKVSGPGTATFASSTSVDTTATFSVVGTYVLRLTGSDSVLSASDDMQVIVGPNNAAPTVSAGADRSISLAQSATLDGTITDDGLPTPPGATTASWTKVSGPGTATFASSTSVDTTATFSVVGTYVLRLTGSDSVLSASDDMQVIVGPNNAAPTVSAGADRSISLAQSATLDGTITDDGLPTPPGATTASWTKVSGPGTATFASSTSVDTTATFSVVGTYVLRLTGSDSVLSASDDMQVIVGPNNAAPTVSAGADRSISLAQSATLDGTITDDGLPTPPGATTASWTKVSGPGTATFASSTSVDTTATFSVVGTYVLRLTGSDSVLSASDDMQVIVGPNNAAPTVSAGADRSISLAQSATLDGTITDDGLPTPPGATTASWTKVSGPGTATFASSTSVDTTATFSVVGTYVLRLTGSDSVLSASDDMQVIVTENDVTLTINVNPAGAGTTTGSGNYTFGANASMTASPNGVWQFYNWTGDASGSANPASLTMNANKTVTANFNRAPTATPQSVTTPKNTDKPITLSGNDPDGDSLTYTVVSGPANGSLTGTGANKTYSPNSNYNGPDSFTFKVNDGKVDSATVTISITVQNTFTLSLVSSPAAGASALVGNGTFVAGTTTSISALANSGFGFINWTGASGITAPGSASTSVLMDANKTITANFNRPPVANTQHITMLKNTAQFFTLTGSDPDGNPLTFTVVGLPANGSISGLGAERAYTPNMNYSGPDSFTFKVNDGMFDSPLVTVTITVQNTFTLTLTANPVGSSTSLTGAGTFVEGSTANISTAPATGYLFSNWSGASGIGNANNASTTVLMNSNKAIVANFTVSNLPPTIDDLAVQKIKALNGHHQKPGIPGDQFPQANWRANYTVPLSASDPDGSTLAFEIHNGGLVYVNETPTNVVFTPAATPGAQSQLTGDLKIDYNLVANPGNQPRVGYFDDKVATIVKETSGSGLAQSKFMKLLVTPWLDYIPRSRQELLFGNDPHGDIAVSMDSGTLITPAIDGPNSSPYRMYYFDVAMSGNQPVWPEVRIVATPDEDYVLDNWGNADEDMTAYLIMLRDSGELIPGTWCHDQDANFVCTLLMDDRGMIGSDGMSMDFSFWQPVNATEVHFDNATPVRVIRKDGTIINCPTSNVCGADWAIIKPGDSVETQPNG